MKFTPYIAAAILAFVHIAPTFAVPLTVGNMNQPAVAQGDLALRPVSVAPNGIMVPGPIKWPIETTDTGLPFDSHPDNLEKFPQIEPTSTAAHYRYRNRPTKRPLIDEETVETDGANKKAKPTEGPHRFGDRAPNFHPWGNIGGHGPVVRPEHPEQEQHKPTLTESQIQKVNHFEHKPTSLPTIPAFGSGGHGLVVNPGLSSRPVPAPASTVTYSNLTGGPVLDHSRRPHKTANSSALPFRRLHPIDVPIDMAGTIARRGLKTSTASGSETFTAEPIEPYPEFEAYKSCMKQPVDIGDLTWYTYELMNAAYMEPISHIENSTHSNETDAKAKELQATIRLEHERNVVFLEAAGLKRHRLCLAKHMPSYQIHTITPRKLNSSDYEKAHKEWIEVESQVVQMAKQTYDIESLIIPSADRQYAVAPFSKADLFNLG